MARIRRDRRRRRAHTRLTGRDEMLLHALARFGVARTAHLVALGFGGVRQDTAARRLRRLYDGGYLDVRAASRTEQNLYVLGPAGKRWLEARGVPTARCPRGGLTHHLAIVGAWVELVLAVHAIAEVELERVRPDWELRAAADHRLSVVPDLLARIRVGRSAAGAESISIAVEVDRGTESPRVLRAKLTRYAVAWGHQGTVDWRRLVLVFYSVAGGPGRLAAVDRLLRETWLGRWFICRPDELGAFLEPMIGASSPPLTGSPRSKGREIDVTAEFSVSGRRSSAGP